MRRGDACDGISTVATGIVLGHSKKQSGNGNASATDVFLTDKTIAKEQEHNFLPENVAGPEA